MEFRKNLIRPKIVENSPAPRNNTPALPPKPINPIHPRNFRPVTQPIYYPRPIQYQPRQTYYPAHQNYPSQHYLPQQHYASQQFHPPRQPSQQFRNPIPERNFATSQRSTHLNNGPPNNGFQRQVPMEVDTSIRSHLVNYGNRPPTGPPQKRPRNFHIETQQPYYDLCNQPDNEYEQYFQLPYSESHEDDGSFERYCKTIEHQTSSQSGEQEHEQECAELNFLD